MTQPCEDLDIACPASEENYAAIAKQLHRSALEAEEKIFCLERQLLDGVNRPTYIATTTADITGIIANVPFVSSHRQQLFTSSASVVIDFQNSPLTLFNGFPTPPRGVYHMGVSLNAVASGTVDDNTYRRLEIATFPASVTINTAPLDLEETSDLATRTMQETNTAVENYMTLSTVFKVDGTQKLRMFFSHGNTSSTMTILTGARVWITRLSDDTLLKVV